MSVAFTFDIFGNNLRKHEYWTTQMLLYEITNTDTPIRFILVSCYSSADCQSQDNLSLSRLYFVTLIESLRILWKF